MRRHLVLLLALGLVAGCAAKPTPPPTAPVGPKQQPAASVSAEQQAPPTSGPAPAHSTPAPSPAPGREALPDGFRIGPYEHIGQVRWVGSDRVYGVFSHSGESILGIADTREGMPRPLYGVTGNRAFYITEPVLDGQAVLFSGLEPGHWLRPAAGEPRKIADGWQWQLSPDRTRVISYPKGGGSSFVDLRTGQGHKVEAPGYYGSNMWDSWAPDGKRYLVQARREDKVPGFYFLDGSARPAGTWHEPGHYSLWASWSPDSTKVAFLSVPIDKVYPKNPEAWADPQVAPRLGVLDVASGKARYFSLEGKLVGGRTPLWSPDGKRVAVLCGDLDTGEAHAQIAASRVCVADLAAGKLTPVTSPVAPPGRAVLDTWSPDGRSLVYGVYANPSAVAEYLMVPADGGLPLALPGQAVWINDDRFIAIARPGTMALTLHDRQGRLIREVATGENISWVTVGPDRSWYAFAVDNTKHARDLPSTYLVVIRAGE